MSDVRGRIHRYDYDLNLEMSSPVVTYDRPINALTVYGDYVLTKDRFGAVGKWDLRTLRPLDFYDGAAVCDRSSLYEDEVVSPSPNRGIACLNGRLYTCNGFNQLVVIDVDSFQLLDVRESPSKTFVDCICVDNPDLHALTDVDGTIYIGNLETNDFPVRAVVDSNVVHGVTYDWRHHRFWTTQDGGLGPDKSVRTGVTTIETDGSGLREYKISHEDNEFIAFDADCRHLFVGGFNGKICVFDNEGPDFALVRVMGPLDFQVISAAVVSADQVYALLQTGRIVRLDGRGEVVCQSAYDNACIWTLEPHPADWSVLYAGTDHGVAILKYGPGAYDTVDIDQLALHDLGFGIVKDVRPMADGSYVAISRKGYAYRASSEGHLLWSRQVLGIPRGVAVDDAATKCLVSTDDGDLLELDAADGSLIDAIPLGGPSYACLYTEDGRRVATCDNGRQILVFPADSHELAGSIRGFEYRLKRLIRGSEGQVFVTGPDGMFELDLTHFTCSRGFGAYMVSTKENGVYCDGYVHVGGYGYQLASYRYSDGVLVDLKETLPDYTKAFAAHSDSVSAPVLLVGGRGGFLCAFRVRRGVPHKVREFHLRVDAPTAR